MWADLLVFGILRGWIFGITWKPTGPIKSYFGLEEGGDLPRIEGWDASGYTILESKGGITYGQRMSGPTDAIDIDFTGYFDRLPDRVQGALERAGKSWSYRLKDVLGPHLSTDEVATGMERTPDGRIPPREVDGILIRVRSDLNTEVWDNEWGNSSAVYRTTQTVGEDFTVRTSGLDLAAVTINRGSDIGYTVEDSYPTEPEQYSYGAWAEHSAWVVLSARTMTFTSYRITDHIMVEADVFGTPPDRDFAEVHTGTLTWNGSLLATDTARFSPVFGDAEITLSADTLDGTAQFMDLQTVRDVDGQAHLTGWRKSSLAYGVRVEGNGLWMLVERWLADFMVRIMRKRQGFWMMGWRRFLGRLAA